MALFLLDFFYLTAENAESAEEERKRGDRQPGFQRLKNNKGKAFTTRFMLKIQVFFCKCFALILILCEVYLMRAKIDNRKSAYASSLIFFK